MKERKDLQQRTKEFSLSIIRIFEFLQKTPTGYILGKQLLRSATSVGAQYREARRSRSNAEFISKVEGAIQELDETTYWLELIVDAKIFTSDLIESAQKEADELISILVTCGASPGCLYRRFKRRRPSSFILPPSAFLSEV